MKNNKKGPAVKGADLNVPAEDYQYIENTEGAAKAKPGGNKGDESAKTKAEVKKVKAEATKDYEGPGKMGYTQNFGPARQGGYAKGAAKVNSIMGNGPAQLDKAKLLEFGDFSDAAKLATKKKAKEELQQSAYLDSLNLAVNLGKGSEAKALYGERYTMNDTQVLRQPGYESAMAFQAKGQEHAQDVINMITKKAEEAKKKSYSLNFPSGSDS